MYDRKEREKVEKDLGWPSCHAFQQHGSEQCGGCQHNGVIKSPLNLAVPVIPNSALDRIIEELKNGKIDPVVAMRELHQRGADDETMFAALNNNYPVVKYGSETVIASINGNEVSTMKVHEFHKIFANVRVWNGKRDVEISRLWFNWPNRRQYMRRGIAFEPGGPLDVPDDMLNLWRGFGVKPRQGDWSFLRSHILNVLCSGRQDLFDYLLGWMAHAVQHPDEPIGVAIALRGPQGAGKGIIAHTFGRIFGRHFAHIANGEQLTGHFNASVATSVVVFLDEAIWAGEKKAEGVLKALITEPRLQLEAKFRDPIMVDNHLHIIVASNNAWFVPAGTGDRRWFILDVADTFAGFGHEAYWDPLYNEIENGGVEAMLYDLCTMDLTRFNPRAIPHTAAKAHQQVLSLNGTPAWLYDVLQEGRIGAANWNADGMTIATDQAYACYEDFSKRQRDWRPKVKAVWSKELRDILGLCIGDTRQLSGTGRVRLFQFMSLASCRQQFAALTNSPWSRLFVSKNSIALRSDNRPTGAKRI